MTLELNVFKLRLRVSGPARNISAYRLCLNGPEDFLEEWP